MWVFASLGIVHNELMSMLANYLSSPAILPTAQAGVEAEPMWLGSLLPSFCGLWVAQQDIGLGLYQRLI